MVSKSYDVTLRYYRVSEELIILASLEHQAL